MSNAAQAVVIDNGSGTCKIGIAGETAPRTAFPTCIGYPKRDLSVFEKDYYIGQVNYSLMTVHRPVCHGIVDDWDDMEKIWEHAFGALQVASEDQAVLLTEPPINPRINREKTAQIMFETFNVPGFYLGNQAALALRAAGRTTGVVLDSGYGVTHSVPVQDGVALSHATNRMVLGSSNLIIYFAKLLKVRGYEFNSTSELAIVKSMLEKIGYVALELESFVNETAYKVPDGPTITIGDERVKSQELLFQPSLLQYNFPGIHQLVTDSIAKCGNDLSEQLYRNVILAGGNSLFPGISERMTKELTALAPDSLKSAVNVVAHPEGINAAWRGGSIFASLGFQSAMISRDEYDENGTGILYTKCL